MVSSFPLFFLFEIPVVDIMWQPGWEGILGENGYMHMYGWVLSCSPETVATLLIGFTPIQNKKSIKNKISVVDIWWFLFWI